MLRLFQMCFECEAGAVKGDAVGLGPFELACGCRFSKPFQGGIILILQLFAFSASHRPLSAGPAAIDRAVISRMRA